MDNNVSLIANTYKIIGQIGSGGGGIVYLAEHMRLGKKVVLKADKRTQSAKPEVLRREVDALKDLSHTYIPQVYDFIEENGTVYTVMDFIDGDSFDKPLKRGDRFSQAQVIEWACQLLQALAYLHNRPPHGILHADIKPSNIMLTPQGDVRLIDFNIALALGEEGAVAVGRSFGYASPEHYGVDYSSVSATQGINTEAATDLSGETLSDVKTVLENDPRQSSSSSTSGSKTIMLNVRSDIYSLGATLYHIMTGERPAQNATEVKPISAKDFSPAVIAIISKAMNPDQNLRWQTAEEMLYAFEHLHQNDPRTKRHKRTTIITAAILTVIFLAGGLTVFAGQRLMEQEQRQIAEEARLLEETQRQIAEEERQRAEEQGELARLNEAYTLAEYSANALREGDTDRAVEYALQAISLTGSPIAEAQKALTDALGVYDLSDGYKPHKSVSVPGEVIKFAVSPGESAVSAMTLGLVTVFNPETGEVIAELPAVDSALADVLFLDDATMIYAGLDGITAYDLRAGKTLWTGDPAATIAVSADGEAIAAVYRDSGEAAAYSADGERRGTVQFGDRHLRVAVNDRLADPEDNLFALNADGTLLAVSFSDGSLEIFNLENSDNNIEIFDESDYNHFEGGFSGDYLVFSATNTEESLFAAIDVIKLEQTDGWTAPERVGVTADERGVFLTFRDKYTKYDPKTLEETDPEYDRLPPGYTFEHSIDSQEVIVSKLISHADKDIFSYDSFYDHDEARLSGDGSTVMLFSIHGFRLYDIGGEIIAELALEDGIYDQQYRRTDGESYLEVIWYDGTVRKYSAADGTLFYDEKTAPPDESLYEEFITDSIKITSALHGTPAAYDIKTGEQIRELERDAYLTYVTQSGEYIITEYIRAEDGARYGLLLNAQCETLAYLPNLCDVIGDRLIFDFEGRLRETRIFKIDELISLAR